VMSMSFFMVLSFLVGGYFLEVALT
jgi:hypothetical protein